MGARLTFGHVVYSYCLRLCNVVYIVRLTGSWCAPATYQLSVTLLSYLVSLDLSFLNYKMGIIIVLSLGSCREDWRRTPLAHSQCCRTAVRVYYRMHFPNFCLTVLTCLLFSSMLAACVPWFPCSKPCSGFQLKSNRAMWFSFSRFQFIRTV